MNLESSLNMILKLEILFGNIIQICEQPGILGGQVK
jgi:hypothetical protein